MNKQNIISQIGSYFLSGFAAVKGAFLLSFLTGLAGAALTTATAYKVYQEAQLIKAQRKQLLPPKTASDENAYKQIQP